MLVLTQINTLEIYIYIYSIYVSCSAGYILKPQNRNRQNRIIGIGIGDFDYSIMRSICRLIIDKKMFVPRETKEWQDPVAPSSFTQHGSISLPTQPVDNYDWAL